MTCVLVTVAFNQCAVV